MNTRRIFMALCVALLCAGLAVSGCAFGKFGKANVTYSDVSVPSGLNGQSKANTLKMLGVPDSVAKAGSMEYWGYVNKGGFFVLLFGKTIQKDLVLEFRGDTVSSSYLVDKGSSMGIFAPQGAVAN